MFRFCLLALAAMLIPVGFASAAPQHHRGHNNHQYNRGHSYNHNPHYRGHSYHNYNRGHNYHHNYHRGHNPYYNPYYRNPYYRGHGNGLYISPNRYGGGTLHFQSGRSHFHFRIR